MKAVLIFLFAFCISINSSTAQPTTWAQPGAHWIYNFGDGTSFGSTGITEILRAGDTLVNGITCDILTIHQMYQQNWPGGQYVDMFLPNRYTYRSNDTVFISYSGSFEILFIATAQPGSNWITGPDIFDMCPGDTLFIDSLQSVTINGITMNKITPLPFPGSWFDESVYFNAPFFERFGSLQYILPLPTCVTDMWGGPLICYTDSSGFLYSPNPSIPCPVGISEMQDTKSEISIYPVISSTSIVIEAGKNLSLPVELNIINASGKIIEEIKLTNEKTEYDISYLSNGMYFLQRDDFSNSNSGIFIKL